MSATVSRFLHGLNDTVQGRREDRIAQAARASVETVIETGATIAIAQPYRIPRALDEFAPMVWHRVGDLYNGKTLTEWLTIARRKVADHRRLGRSNHWAFDSNRLIALEQATRALGRMVDAEARKKVEGAI